MKNILIYIFLGIIPCFMTSCFEDLGNYDYTEINEVNIEGIADSYTIYQGADFVIEPDLAYTMDDSDDSENYEYEWFLHKHGALALEKEKFLSNERNLNVPLSVAPGDYTGYYRVRDKSSGVQFATKFGLQVISSVFEGWIVMSDINGKARLDMASRLNEEYVVIPDILTYSGSELQLEGAPGLVYCYPYDPSQYGIYVTSEATGTTKIDPDTFGWSEDLRLTYEATGVFPSDWTADNMYSREFNSAFVVSGGNVYYYLRIFQVEYGVPINKVTGESSSFTASRYISSGTGFSGTSILFDEDNKRFVRHLGSTQVESALMPEGTLFDYNIGMDLVFMVRSRFNGGEAFAILDDNGQYYIARIAQSGSNLQQVYFEAVNVPDFDQAENFTIHPDYGYLFFNIGSRVYEYDLSTKVAHEMLNLDGKEITQLKFYDLFSPREYTSHYEKQLMVGVNDPTKPAESSGSLEFYNVPPVNDQITFDSKLEGFGRIVSVAYRER